MWIDSIGLRNYLTANNCSPVYSNYYEKNDTLMALLEKYNIFQCFRNKL